MRNNLLILLLILAAGCTKNSHSLDDVQPLDAYIFFDANVAKTKGNFVEGESLPAAANTAFGVMGVRGSNEQVFDMYTNEDGYSFSNVAKMYRPKDGDDFVYDKLALWTKVIPHSFYAFYPYDADCINVVEADDVTTEGTDPYISYTQPTDLNKMTDILTAKVEGSLYDEKNNNLVALEFGHRLFAFDMVVKNTLEDEVVVTGASITFTDVAGTAKFYFGESITNDGTVTFTTDLGKHTVPAGSETEPKEYSLNSETSFLLIPCDKLKVSFTLKFLSNLGTEIEFTQTDIELTPTPPSESEVGKFEAGRKYALKLTRKVSDNTVTFVPEIIADWGSKDITHTFN